MILFFLAWSHAGATSSMGSPTAKSVVSGPERSVSGGKKGRKSRNPSNQLLTVSLQSINVLIPPNLRNPITGSYNWHTKTEIHQRMRSG